MDKNLDDAFKNKQPFLIRREKKGSDTTIDPKKKVELLRTANALFKDGDIERAKKIFLLISNTDGIKRVGDYYYEKKDYIQAYQMYTLAPYEPNRKILIEAFARSIRKWLKS